jgi:hypothetical protein
MFTQEQIQGCLSQLTDFSYQKTVEFVFSEGRWCYSRLRGRGARLATGAIDLSAMHVRRIYATVRYDSDLSGFFKIQILYGVLQLSG